MKGSVLADTSVWVSHFRQANPALVARLHQGQVVMHPFVSGELACSTPPARQRTLHDLALLQPSRQVTVQETMALIDREQLFGQGCGLVDMMLLASVLLTPGLALWTLDQRLAAQAARFGVLGADTFVGG